MGVSHGSRAAAKDSHPQSKTTGKMAAPRRKTTGKMAAPRRKTTGKMPVLQGENMGKPQGRAWGPRPLLRSEGYDVRVDKPLKILRGARLPHWTREGASYAVTFRLADSLPKAVLASWEFERGDIIKTAKQLGRTLTSYEARRLDTLFSEKVDKYLDEGQGRCRLREDRIATVVASAFEFFDELRYRLFAWCIMPNHVHIVIQPLAGHELPQILHSWKSYTAKEINKLLRAHGAFWEVEYYDHLIRDERDFKAQIEYAWENPQKAGLQNWKWTSIARAFPL